MNNHECAFCMLYTAVLKIHCRQLGCENIECEKASHDSVTGWGRYKEECGGFWTTNICSGQYNGITGLQWRFPEHRNEISD